MECAGMRPVIVHGGGKAISARLKELGVPTRFVHGLRYTCERTIEVVDQVLHEVVNADLVRTMEEFRGRPQSVSGKDVLRAERIRARDEASGREEDVGFVGRVVSVDTTALEQILDRRFVPVIAPLGRDAQGNALNINGDMAACRIAEELRARKLVFLSDVPGILRDPSDESSLISTVHSADVPALIRDGVIAGGMVPKVRSAVSALHGGTAKVHMIDGRIQHSLLLEIFTDSGIGTQIVD
jgi:acetylglutamate kinase